MNLQATGLQVIDVPAGSPGRLRRATLHCTVGKPGVEPMLQIRERTNLTLGFAT